MLHANPTFIFFGYLAAITVLCPICEKVSNRLSHK
jgi:hypothetical protein